MFFLGKGGVGKSTCSVLSSAKLAVDGYKTLLISMDPAHNLSDIFEYSFSEKPIEVMDNLLVKEIDLNNRIKKYLAGVQMQISNSYTYLTSFNLQQHLDVMKYSPAMEEYALLSVFTETCKNFGPKMDYIIFDMPPTALSLRFFGLASLSLIWLNKLLELRKQIFKKKEIITRIKFAKKEMETDKVLININRQIADYEKIKTMFSNAEKTHINLVMNPEKLSLNESLLIYKRLDEYGLSIGSLYLNKYRNEDTENIQTIFPELNIKKVHFSQQPLIGKKNILTYLQEHPFEYLF